MNNASAGVFLNQESPRRMKEILLDPFPDAKPNHKRKGRRPSSGAERMKVLYESDEEGPLPKENQNRTLQAAINFQSKNTSSPFANRPRTNSPPFDEEERDSILKNIEKAIEDAEQERTRRILAEEAAKASTAAERSRNRVLSIELEEQERNRRCIQNPGMSRRPREIAVNVIFETGEFLERVENQRLADALMFEEKLRAEVVQEYFEAQLKFASRSARKSLQILEETERQQRMEENRSRTLLSEKVEAFVNFLSSFGFMGVQGSLDAYHRYLMKPKVLKAMDEEKERRCTENTVPVSLSTDFLQSILMTLENMERKRNRKRAALMQSFEKARRMTLDCISDRGDAMERLYNWKASSRIFREESTEAVSRKILSLVHDELLTFFNRLNRLKGQAECRVLEEEERQQRVTQGTEKTHWIMSFKPFVSPK